MATVRLFASLRELAGAPSVDLPGDTVEDLLQAAARRYGETFDRIARAGSVILDGERASGAEPIAGREEIAFLPPVSGGSR